MQEALVKPLTFPVRKPLHCPHTLPHETFCLYTFIPFYFFLTPVKCPEGYVSKTGTEPCFPCPQGYFQPQTGQSSCFLCPGQVRTASHGSTRQSDCEGVRDDVEEYDSIPTSRLVVNECFKEPCQNGVCVSLAVAYTCNCTTGWTGGCTLYLRKIVYQVLYLIFLFNVYHCYGSRFCQQMQGHGSRKLSFVSGGGCLHAKSYHDLF